MVTKTARLKLTNNTNNFFFAKCGGGDKKFLPRSAAVEKRWHELPAHNTEPVRAVRRVLLICVGCPSGVAAVDHTDKQT